MDPAALEILHPAGRAEVDDSTPAKIHTCFKCLRRVTRLLIRHARNLRRLRYGKALLRMFIKKPSATLKSILRSAEKDEVTTPLPIDLSLIRGETTGRLITAPDKAVA